MSATHNTYWGKTGEVAQVPYKEIASWQPEAESKVVEQFDFLTNLAKDLIGSALDAINAVAYPTKFDPSNVDIADAGSISTDLAVDEFSPEPVSVNVESFGKTPQTTAIPEIKTREVKAFDKAAPTIALPEKPKKDISVKPEFLDQLAQVDLPAKPKIDADRILSEIKKLQGITIPEDIPSWTPVSFDEKLDIDSANYNKNTFNFNETRYTSPIINDLIQSLLSSLVVGGIGLYDDDENAIYQRHKARINAEYAEAFRKENARLAAMGVRIPTGAHVAQLHALEEKKNQALANASYEVMSENAKLEYEDRQAVRQVSVQLEGVLREYIAGYWNRALEAAKETAQEGHRLFQVVVQQNQLKLEEYKTKANVYEIEVRASLLELEAFTKKLQAASLQKEIRGQDADLIMQWAQAAIATAQIYETELKGAMAVNELNRTKVALYGEQLRGYMSELEAYGTDISAWKTEIDAEMSQLSIFEKEADVYGKEVQATIAYNQTEISKAETAIKQIQAYIEEFKGYVAAYEAQTDAKTAEAQIKGRIIDAQASAYTAKTNAQVAQAKTKAEIELSRIQTNLQKINMALEQNKINIAAQMNETQIKGEQLKSIANNKTQLLASTLAALNVSASIGAAQNRSATEGYGVSLGNSYSFGESNSLNQELKQ